MAQPFPSFGGIEARIGVASPKDADPGLSAAVDLDLGSVGIGSLRTIAGFHYFAVNRDSDAAEDPGSYTATGGRLGLRLDLFGRQRLSPYVLGALTGHRVSADVAEPRVRDLLEGFYAGVSFGGGAALSLDESGVLAVTGEARRTVASNIAHNVLELGVRFQPRGRATYNRRAGIGGDARSGEAARIAVERERAEAERRRLEEERLAAERARAEQERLARMTEEERRRAGQQVVRAEEEAELA
ncbi:MAG TPA: hypothetical protein VGR37_22020, partial [Longimicrobiaceae bacterium]|nr:hypothetical protein [Longimicrobiaceae bacterium]